MKCGATNEHCLGEEGTQSADFFIRRGFARKRRRPREMSSFKKSIWNSLTTPEQKQEPYRDGVPMLGQPTRTALHFGAPGARQVQVLLDALPARSRRRLLPVQQQTAQVWQRCRWRPGAPSKESGHHVTVVLLCRLSSPTLMYPHSRSRRCLRCPAPHVEGVVQARKKVMVHGLLQRAPRLLGSSREGWQTLTRW